MPAQALAASMGQPQQPMLAPVPQVSAAPTGADSDAYARARAAANVRQTNRNIAAQ
jgi:hypothetical protein